MLRHPAFGAVSPAVARLPRDRWPSHEALTALASEAGVATATGRAVRFVPPLPQKARDGLGYEERIARTGEVATRGENWHDLLNALAWVSFPRAKAALSAAHAEALRQGGHAEARRRSPVRDALTLFDEGGVVAMASAAEWFDLIRDHQWKRLFWESRAALARDVRVLAFGHALMESMLTPYVGITARVLFMPAEATLLAATHDDQARAADAFVADSVVAAQRASATLAHRPLPVLGLPGWHADGERETFYDDHAYFRPRRHAAPAQGSGNPMA